MGQVSIHEVFMTLLRKWSPHSTAAYVAAAICVVWASPPAQAQQEKPLFDRMVAALPPAPHEEFLGARIQRTMSLLANSTKDRQWPVTFLIYGQSITAGLKQSRMEEAIRQKFPQAQITFLNRSISGFSASQLVRSMWNDVYPLDPDLVILHDMGASLPEYERMVENLRRYTTAEIILCTDPLRAEDDVDAPPTRTRDRRRSGTRRSSTAANWPTCARSGVHTSRRTTWRRGTCCRTASTPMHGDWKCWWACCCGTSGSTR